VFNGYLYAGMGNLDAGGEIWRTNDDTTWTQVNTDGFGDPDNDAIILSAVFDGYLYAGTGNDTTGGQVWRCSTGSGCDENSDWTQVVSDGFGSTDNLWGALIVSDNDLYCVTRNDETGAEVWRSSTGDSGDWEQVGSDGFGDSNNQCSYLDNSVAAGSLYIGTFNWANGGELWQFTGGGPRHPALGSTCPSFSRASARDEGAGYTDRFYRVQRPA
jgi:flagellin